MPIWVANFVLGEYGTGAVMAVPAHDQRDFEFARKYDLPIRVVVGPADGDGGATSTTMTEAVSNDGVLVNSGPWDGMPSDEARQALTADASTRGHRRRDRAVPAEGLGHLAAALLGHADSDDPLPDRRHRRRAGRSAAGRAAQESRSSRGRGDSPLAQVPEFVNVTCPKCGGPARRETDTMDTFVDSSWYFYRFADAHNDKLPFDPAKVGVLVRRSTSTAAASSTRFCI